MRTEPVYATKEEALAAGNLNGEHWRAWTDKLRFDLIDALKARGFTVVDDAEHVEAGLRDPNPTVDGFRLSELIRVNNISSSYGYRYSRTSSIEIRVRSDSGYRHDKGTFRRLKKDGTFDLEPIVTAVVLKIEANKRRQAAWKEQSRLQGVSRSFGDREEFNYKNFPVGHVSFSFGDWVKVSMQFNPEKDQEKLLKLAEFLKTL